MTAYGYLYNLQGNVVALVNGAGTKVVEYTYDAWGVQLTRTGTMANSLGKIQPFRYRGYVYDEESGLYYLRSRYYRPGWGRFVSADVLVNGNLYSYTHSSPISSIDVDGMDDRFVSFDDLKNFCENGMYINVSINGTGDDNTKYTIIKGSYCYPIPSKEYPNQYYITTFAWQYGNSRVKPGWGVYSLFVSPNYLSPDLDSAVLPDLIKSEGKKERILFWIFLLTFIFLKTIWRI